MSDTTTPTSPPFKKPRRDTDIENDIFKGLKQRLTEGTLTPDSLPKDYMEHQRIVPPDSEAGKAFQKEMEKQLRFLIADPKFHASLKEHPIHFVLSDTGSENGYIIPSEGHSLICLDRSLLKTFKNENQLAYVLLHELTHLKTYQLFGEGKNTQVEEGACDARPLVMMSEVKLPDDKVGLNMEEAKEWMRNSKGFGRTPSWMSLIDAHPLPHYRVDLMENVLAGLRSLRGTLGAADKMQVLPIPTELQTLVEGNSHQSYIKQKLTEQDYEHKNAAEQLTILKGLLPAMEGDELPRMQDFAATIARITYDPKNAEQIRIGSEIADALLENPRAFNQVYPFLDVKLFQPAGIFPQKRLARLEELLLDFTDPETKTDIKTIAAEVQSILKTFPHSQINWANVQMPYFQLESKKTYKAEMEDNTENVTTLPWHDMADDQVRRPNSDVIRTMWMLGALDPRLVRAATLEDKQWFLENTPSSRCCFSTPHDEKEKMNLSRLLVDQSGYIYKFMSETSLGGISVHDNYGTSVKTSFDEEKRQKTIAEAGVVKKNTSNVVQDITFKNLPVAEFFKDPMVHLAANHDQLILEDSARAATQMNAGIEHTITTDKASRREVDRDRQELAQITLKSLIGCSSAGQQMMDYFTKMAKSNDDPACPEYKKFIRGYFLSNHSSSGAYPVNFLKALETNQFVDETYHMAAMERRNESSRQQRHQKVSS